MSGGTDWSGTVQKGGILAQKLKKSGFFRFSGKNPSGPHFSQKTRFFAKKWGPGRNPKKGGTPPRNSICGCHFFARGWAFQLLFWGGGQAVFRSILRRGGPPQNGFFGFFGKNRKKWEKSGFFPFFAILGVFGQKPTQKLNFDEIQETTVRRQSVHIGPDPSRSFDAKGISAPLLLTAQIV